MGTWAVFPLWLLYTRVQVFTWTYVFISLGCIPGSGIAGPHGNCLTFEDLPDCCPRLLRRLHSRQQHVRAPACPHRHLYVWSACVAAAGFVAGKWCLLLGLTCCGPRRALLAGLPSALGGTGPAGRRVFCPRRCSCLSPRGGYKPGAVSLLPRSLWAPPPLRTGAPFPCQPGEPPVLLSASVCVSSLLGPGSRWVSGPPIPSSLGLRLSERVSNTENQYQPAIRPTGCERLPSGWRGPCLPPCTHRWGCSGLGGHRPGVP